MYVCIYMASVMGVKRSALICGRDLHINPVAAHLMQAFDRNRKY